MIDWRFVSRIKPQMTALMEGVHELIPDHLLRIFDANELEVSMLLRRIEGVCKALGVICADAAVRHTDN